MHITLTDQRTLAVCIVQPVLDRFYNPTTGGMETPFNAEDHLIPFVPMEKAPSIFSEVVVADIGNIMLERTDVNALILTVDASGAPIAVVDNWTSPSPTPNPGVGGYMGS